MWVGSTPVLQDFVKKKPLAWGRGLEQKCPLRIQIFDGSHRKDL